MPGSLKRMRRRCAGVALAALGAVESDRKAEFDGGRVQGVGGIGELHATVLVGMQRAGLGNQALRQIRV